MIDEAREAIGRGKDVLTEHVSDIVDVAAKKGRVLAEQARRQSLSVLALAARHGSNLLEDWADIANRSIPKRRRNFGANVGKFLMGAAAIAAVGYFVISANRAQAASKTA